MRSAVLKKIVLLVLLSLFSFGIFAVSESEDYIYWYTPSRFDETTDASDNDKEALASSSLPLGTVVELSVNGETKEMTVSDRSLDRRAAFGVDARSARSLGFYPFLREKVSYRILRMGKNDEELDDVKRSTWYTITPLYPKEGDDIITLSSSLISEGFKCEVDKSGSYAEVKFIPSFSVDSDLEYLKEMVDTSYPIKAVRMR